MGASEIAKLRRRRRQSASRTAVAPKRTLAAIWRGGIAALGGRSQLLFRQFRSLAPATMVAFCLALLGAVLDFTSPGRDIVAAQFQERHDIGSLVILAVALAACSFIAWAVARKAVIDAYGPEITQWGGWKLRTWLLMMPRLLWAIPFVTLIVPLMQSDGVTARMRAGFVVVWLLAAVVGSLALATFAFLRGPNRHIRSVFAVENDWVGFPWLLGISPGAGLGLVLLAAVLIWPVVAPRQIGAAAIGLFAVASTMATLGCVYAAVKFEIPTEQRISGGGSVRYLPLSAIGVLLLAGVAVARCSDSHVVSGMVAARGPTEWRPKLDDEVTRFLARLPPGTAKQPVPVVFVASAGGASRAAYWTGEVLGKLDELTQGRFGDHVFAVSSVSGGTLGAATYLAERAENSPTELEDGGPSQLRKRMRKENGDDHLSPAIAGLLFPDLLQLFVPWAILPDRATYLERSFQDSWLPRAEALRYACAPDGSRRKLSPDAPLVNRFSRPMGELWSCATMVKDQPVWIPAFFANGTRAEDGRRIITSSILMPQSTFGDALDFHDLFIYDVPLSTVVTNSARFPFFSPAGTLPPHASSRGARGHIIDGGYFENGGIATITEVQEAFDRVVTTQKKRDPHTIRYVFVEINNDDAGDPRQRANDIIDNQPTMPPLEIYASSGLDGLLPLSGLYETRGARGTLEAIRARRWVQADKDHRSYFVFQLCRLWDHDHEYGTEMNWALSKVARARLDVALDQGSKDPGCRWQDQLTKLSSMIISAHLPAVISAHKPRRKGKS